MRAAGRRYSGSYRDENQGKDVLPRIDWWGVWNEPNQPGWLTPQGETKRGVGEVAAAPHIYRDLLVAGAKALLRTGHGDDLLLIGELAPIGSAVKPKGARASLRPGLFLREMFCLDGRFRPYMGSEARARGCDKLDRLAVLERFPRIGVGHHAYTRKRAPTKRQPKRDMIDISNLGELTRTLDRIAARTGLLPPETPVFLDRVRVSVAAPGPVQGRLTAPAGQVHQRGRLHRLEEPTRLLERPVPALRRAGAHGVPARLPAVLGNVPDGAPVRVPPARVEAAP